jgi:hypothetical protein
MTLVQSSFNGCSTLGSAITVALEVIKVSFSGQVVSGYISQISWVTVDASAAYIS